MSELAAGAMVAGSARLIFGTVQLLLFTFGVLAAARVLGPSPAELANLRVDELGPWAPWAGLLLVGVGVYLNVSAPRGALPWMLALLALTFLAQSGGQEAYGAPVGGFLGGLVAALGAALVQRFHGPPSLVVFLPAFWLLVPGSLGLLGHDAARHRHRRRLRDRAGSGRRGRRDRARRADRLGARTRARGARRSPPGVRLRRFGRVGTLTLMFKKLAAKMGAGAATVDAVLSTPTVRPGEQVTGIVHVEGGDVEQEINRITVALETVVEVETDDSEFNSTQRFATQPITGGMIVRPNERQQYPFTLQVPYETPLTHIEGHQLPGVRMGVRTELEIARSVDKGDLDPVQIVSLPGQTQLLEALAQLGFRFKSADVEKGQLRGATLPFFQEIEFSPARSTAASSTSSRSPSSAARRRPA